jgi:hypothetical protein
VIVVIGPFASWRRDLAFRLASANIGAACRFSAL